MAMKKNSNALTLLNIRRTDYRRIPCPEREARGYERKNRRTCPQRLRLCEQASGGLISGMLIIQQRGPFYLLAPDVLSDASQN